MKLKTLKDCYMSDGRNYEQRLKEEAIKWVRWFREHINPKKEIEKMKSSPEAYYSVIDREELHSFDRRTVQDIISQRESIMNWIEDFFNLTEEELK